MNSGKVVLGIMAGVAVGALLGVLLAPDKGSATRRNISKKAGGYAEDLKHTFNEYIESLAEKFKTSKEEVEDIIEKGKITRAKHSTHL